MNNAEIEEFDLEKTVDDILLKYEAKPSALLTILEEIQEYYRYLPEEALKLVANKMSLPVTQIFSVATFYKSFSLTPKGKHRICACTGTACHIRQSWIIVDCLKDNLGIAPNETTKNGDITLETVNCMGACALGPIVTIDEHYYGHMNTKSAKKLIAELKEVLRKERIGEESK